MAIFQGSQERERLVDSRQECDEVSNHVEDSLSRDVSGSISLGRDVCGSITTSVSGCSDADVECRVFRASVADSISKLRDEVAVLRNALRNNVNRPSVISFCWEWGI
jgi:hypothetical protein